jgi:hypothetical protein
VRAPAVKPNARFDSNRQIYCPQANERREAVRYDEAHLQCCSLQPSAHERRTAFDLSQERPQPRANARHDRGSKRVIVTNGMPQSTWFGPYAFNIMIDSLRTINDTYKFVDDVTLTEVTTPSADSQMQHAVNQVVA